MVRGTGPFPINNLVSSPFRFWDGRLLEYDVRHEPAHAILDTALDQGPSLADPGSDNCQGL